MGRAPDADSFIRYDFNWLLRSFSKAMLFLPAQVDFIVAPGNRQRLCQLSGTGTELMNIIHAAPLSHQRNAASRLQGADENKPVFRSFHQHVQHPMNTVIEINVRRPGAISLNEGTRARANEAMTGFVTGGVVGFGFHDYAGARIPIELAANQIVRATEWVPLKKIAAQHLGRPFLTSPAAQLFGL
ncbi:MAG TPA: hypothetical protein VIH43_06780 [Chthoniobacterales bacterium]